MSETEIIAFIAQTALTYIFVSVATNNASQMTVKDTREAFLRESEISTKAIIDIVKAEIKAETSSKKGNANA